LALRILGEEMNYFPDLAAEMDGVGVLPGDRLQGMLA
jgi:hypothetical protein